MFSFLQSLPFLIAFYLFCVYVFEHVSLSLWIPPPTWNLRASELCLSFAIEKKMDGFLDFSLFRSGVLGRLDCC